MEVADLDRQLEEAAVKGDADLLARHLGDDFSFTHVEGTTETKSDYLSRARRIPRRYFFAREVSNQVVEIHGDVALVVGRLDIRGFGPRADPTKTAPSCSAIEYVHLYARRDRQWTFVSNRTTHLVENAGAEAISLHKSQEPFAQRAARVPLAATSEAFHTPSC